jgi:hypothetical protein
VREIEREREREREGKDMAQEEARRYIMISSQNMASMFFFTNTKTQREKHHQITKLN